MIGISISADGIRAVRVKKTGNKMILRGCETAPLEENVVANGDLVNEDKFIEALTALRDAMEIDPMEDIHLGLPTSIFKINSLCVRADTMSNDLVIDEIGLGNDFDVRIFFVSGTYRVETELFERYKLSPEEIRERVARQIESGENENGEPDYTMIKTVSYAACLKTTLEAYLSAFKKSGYKVCSVEPNALAQIRYLKEDATQPFMIVDIDFDYSSLTCFSERTGAFTLNVTDIGKQNLKTYADDEDYDGTVNRPTVDRFMGRFFLTTDFYKKNLITKKDEINLVVFLNSEDDYLFDEIEDKSDFEVTTAETMLPLSLAEKGLDKFINEDFYLYYIPIVLAENGDSSARVDENIERPIEANFLSARERETLLFSTIKTYMSKTSYAVAFAAGLYFASVIGINAVNIVQAGYLQDTPQEVLEKYDEAKEQGDILKKNIAKYNTVAKSRAVYSPLIDAAMAELPNDVFITRLTVNGRNPNTRKLVIECMTSGAESVQKYVDSLAKIPGMEKARVLSQQVKQGKTAAQIIAPLQFKGDGKEIRENKRRKGDDV